MIKSEELSDPNSYLNRAGENELLFVLLARDMAAPDTIRFWANRRIKLGKNKSTDGTILNALRIADEMDKVESISKTVFMDAYDAQ